MKKYRSKNVVVFIQDEGEGSWSYATLLNDWHIGSGSFYADQDREYADAVESILYDLLPQDDVERSDLDMADTKTDHIFYKEVNIDEWSEIGQEEGREVFRASQVFSSLNLPDEFKIVDTINGETYQVSAGLDTQNRPVFNQLWVLEGVIMVQPYTPEIVRTFINSGQWTILGDENVQSEEIAYDL